MRWPGRRITARGRAAMSRRTSPPLRGRWCCRRALSRDRFARRRRAPSSPPAAPGSSACGALPVLRGAVPNCCSALYGASGARALLYGARSGSPLTDRGGGDVVRRLRTNRSDGAHAYSVLHPPPINISTYLQSAR